MQASGLFMPTGITAAELRSGIPGEIQRASLRATFARVGATIPPSQSGRMR